MIEINYNNNKISWHINWKLLNNNKLKIVLFNKIYKKFNKI